MTLKHTLSHNWSVAQEKETLLTIKIAIDWLKREREKKNQLTRSFFFRIARAHTVTPSFAINTQMGMQISDAN